MCVEISWSKRGYLLRHWSISFGAPSFLRATSAMPSEMNWAWPAEGDRGWVAAKQLTHAARTALGARQVGFFLSDIGQLLSAVHWSGQAQVVRRLTTSRTPETYQASCSALVRSDVDGIVPSKVTTPSRQSTSMPVARMAGSLSSTSRTASRIASSLFGRLNGEGVDHIPGAWDTPGAGAGEPRLSEARHFAGERDSTAPDREVDAPDAHW